ncbi:hypothetical protein BV22DRAFT_609449 [Leucogyrophana mollusca]|uniref:Uncharacterized protein n=1 Tax=Leucogyrophana mollusca TaxID=85980 RepID=A0ACB8BD33_9AGAM|nr:hypothetical protein BV22DRAFT_609449 [Leucogyrophana mollusca]
MIVVAPSSLGTSEFWRLPHSKFTPPRGSVVKGRTVALGDNLNRPSSNVLLGVIPPRQVGTKETKVQFQMMVLPHFERPHSYTDLPTEVRGIDYQSAVPGAVVQFRASSPPPPRCALHSTSCTRSSYTRCKILSERPVGDPGGVRRFGTTSDSQ